MVLVFAGPSYSEARSERVREMARERGFYVGASIGQLEGTMTIEGNDGIITLDEDGSAGFVKLGYKINRIRLEGVAQLAEASVKNADSYFFPAQQVTLMGDDSNQKTFMGYIWFDFMENRRWSPYVGFGAGVKDASIDGVQRTQEGQKISDSKTVFSIGVGVNYKINDLANLDIGYRSYRSSDSSSQGGEWNYDDGFFSEDLDVDTNALQVGIRLYIPTKRNRVRNR
ncbi:MAG: porin family protein [Bacteriovoracales bacterium]|nr:porin family protein [Bacteriovoracales bacterium]